MTTEERQAKTEALWRMAQAAGERCRDRTKYEWQINLALWTAMATATAWLLTQREDFHPSLEVKIIGTVIVGCIFGCYVLKWRLPLERANFNDRLKAIYYSNRFVIESDAVPKDVIEAKTMTPKWAKDESDRPLGVNGPHPKGAPKKLSSCLLSVLRCKYGRWSPWFGILITVLLSVALALALWFAGDSAGLEVDKDGPGLRLYDEKGKEIWRAP